MRMIFFSTIIIIAVMRFAHAERVSPAACHDREEQARASIMTPRVGFDSARERRARLVVDVSEMSSRRLTPKRTIAAAMRAGLTGSAR